MSMTRGTIDNDVLLSLITNEDLLHLSLIHRRWEIVFDLEIQPIILQGESIRSRVTHSRLFLTLDFRKVEIVSYVPDSLLVDTSEA